MTSPIKFGRQAQVSHALLAVVYLLPLVYSIPANYNVIVTATLTVFAACWRTSSSETGPEVISRKEALRFPLVGSISLLSLFLAVKFLSKEWVNVIITCYFCLMGVFAVSDVLHDAVHALIPHSIRDVLLIDWKQVTIPFIMPEPEPVKLSVTHAVSGMCGTAFTVWYSLTKHYLANNGLGIAYCLEGISMLNLGSTQIGVILLSGLFLYDIFWVFGTPVMVTVAKSIDGPIKLLFKRAVKDGVPQFGMLGLGDIVIPGIFLALMLQFDHHNKSGHTYFHSACVGYVAGLGATIWVMNVFDAAQPALLYIVPAVLGAVFLQAAVRGEMSRLWLYNHGDKKDGEEGASQDGPEEAEPQEDKKTQ